MITNTHRPSRERFPVSAGQRPSFPKSPATRPLAMRAFSLVEMAVVSAIILALAAISITIYLQARNEAFDTKARENLEHAGNQAASRLISDRFYTYASYGGPTNLATQLFSDDPSLELVPLTESFDGEGNPVPGADRYLGDFASPGDATIGVAIDSNGAMVLSTLSESGRCWLLRHDPAGTTNAAGMVFAQGDPDFCGWSQTWTSDPFGPANEPPVASDATVVIDAGETVSLSLRAVNPGHGLLGPLAFDPDDSPYDPATLAVLADSQIALGDLTSWNDETGDLTWTAPEGARNASFTLDYEIFDGAERASGRITFRVGETPSGPLEIELDCPTDPVAYGSYADCEVVVTSGDPDQIVGYTWTAPDAAPFNCEDDSECSFTRSDPGDVVVTVVAISEDGTQTPADPVTITFVGGTPILNLICDDNVSYAATAECFANAIDPNGGPLTFIWTVPGDVAQEPSSNPALSTRTSPDCGSTPNCSIKVDGPTPDNGFDVSVTVIDLEGDDVTASATVNFVNLSPTTPVIACGTPARHSIDTQTCRVASGGVDPEGGAVTFTWNVSPAPGATSPLLPVPNPATCLGSECVFSSTAPGPVRVEVLATDSFGATASDDANTSFVNTPPRIDAIDCTGPHPYATTDSTCTATISDDPEGDHTSYTYSWSQALGDPSTCTGAPTCDFTRTTPGTVTTTLTVTDPWGSEATRSGTAVFVNVAPAVVLDCSPDETHRRGSITCTATQTEGSNPGPFDYTFADSDDALGVDAMGCNNAPSTCVISTNLSGIPVGSYTFEVKITDEHGGEATATDTVDIVDAPVEVTDSNNCSVSTSDAGSPVWCTVSVTVNDPDDPNTSVGISWPTPANLAKGTCPATVNLNGSGNGTAQCAYRSNVVHVATISPTVGGSAQASTPPTANFTNRAPTLALSVHASSDCDTDGFTGPTRTCTLVATASDPEGGALTFTFPTPAQLWGTPQGTWDWVNNSNTCSGTSAAAGPGANVTRQCSYTWSSSPSTANRRRPPSWAPGQALTMRGQVLAGTVTVRDVNNATASRNTNTLSGFRFRAIANREAPAPQMACANSTVGINTASGTTTLNTPANQQVGCHLHNSPTNADPDNIWAAQYQWDISNGSMNCPTGTDICYMVGSGTSTTIRMRATDRYCQEGSPGVLQPGCNSGHPRSGWSPVLTINWAAPSGGGGGGCSPSRSVAISGLSGGTTNLSGRRYSVFGGRTTMTHCNGASRNVRITFHSASNGVYTGGSSGGFNDLIVQNNHTSGTLVCNLGNCSGTQNYGTYGLVRQECTAYTTQIRLRVDDGSATLNWVSGTFTVPAHAHSGCGGGGWT